MTDTTVNYYRVFMYDIDTKSFKTLKNWGGPQDDVTYTTHPIDAWLFKDKSNAKGLARMLSERTGREHHVIFVGYIP
jgi:hypothetical protein